MEGIDTYADFCNNSNNLSIYSYMDIYKYYVW